MNEYHKIQTVFLRDPDTNFKTLLEGEWAKPEFEYLAHSEWVFTEKVDGTNIRVRFDANTGIEFRGKTDNAQMPPFLLKKLQEMFLPLESQFADMFPTGVCLYGEGYGAKIQKGGGNYRPDQSFVLFDVRIGPWWLQRDSIEDIASKLNIKVVPIIGQGTLLRMVEQARTGFMSTWGNFQAEGIVARPKIELLDRSGHRIITKIKTKDFR